ncbi:MAG: MlaE family ABC transporter permease [Wolbachia sp.]
MQITEQIDALTTLNINPFKYLIAPRILASIIVFPIHIICADLIGIFGGYITAVFEFNHDVNIYIKYTAQFFNINDFITGLIKASAFGVIISVSSCYYGYHCREGARGAGIATTSTVVLSFILIFFSKLHDYFDTCIIP